MTKRLPPQRNKPAYFEPIEKQLVEIFRDLIFRPIAVIARETNAQITGLKTIVTQVDRVLNANDNALARALRTGRIQYEAGVFSGKWNASIVSALKSIGAQVDRRAGVWRLDPARVPGWAKAEAAAYQITAKGAHDKILRALDDLKQNIDRRVGDRRIRAGKTIGKIQADFRETAVAISIKPELSEDSQERLAAEYNDNMKLWIRNFSQEMITDLRDDVEKNAIDGFRFDKLIDKIQSRYGVSLNKAKFLARQETGLFMAKFRRERFGEAGVTRYIWRTSHDERVRPAAGAKNRSNNHRILDGKEFSYDHPPVVDTADGRTANPGEDFNCRCVDEPILDRIARAD